MLNPLPSLAPRLEAFLSELGALQYRHGAGLSSELPLQSLHRQFAEFGREETFAQVKEAADNPRLEDEVRRRLRQVLEFLAGQMEEALAAAAQEDIQRFEVSAQVQTATEQMSLREGCARLSREPNRLQRGALEAAIAQTLADHPGPYLRRVEAAPHTAQRLKYPSYVAMREALCGFSITELAAECESLLRATDDAYRDLLGYVLKKVDPTLKATAGRRHDLSWASSAPWMAEHFTRERLLPTVFRWLEELGFSPTAGGRIRVDAEERPSKIDRAFMVAIRVPDDVRLVVRPGGGLEDYYLLLHELGHSQHAAHISPHLPVEDRRLGDASLTEGYAFLFHQLLLDEGWHRRYLGLSRPVAREAARVAAFNDLCRLRKYAARLPYELVLLEGGAPSRCAEEYEERLSRALGVPVAAGFYLQDRDPQLYSARYLRAWGLEVVLHDFCQGRFNEDFWRNPAAGSWLQGLFAQGQRARCEEVATQLGGTLSLERAGQRLVQVLGA